MNTSPEIVTAAESDKLALHSSAGCVRLWRCQLTGSRYTRGCSRGVPGNSPHVLPVLYCRCVVIQAVVRDSHSHAESAATAPPAIHRIP